MPRTSGVATYWVRRESGGTSANNTGQLIAHLVLSGSGTVKLTGSGALAMTLTLSGSGVVVGPVITRPFVTHLRRRTK